MTRPNRISEPSRVPTHTTPDTDGIILGCGPIAVGICIDFMCPFCRAFEERHGPAVDELVARSGLITLVYHPLGFLDRLSTTRYPTRASAASGCASDGGRFLDSLYTLFDNQPPEASAGLSDEELAKLGVQTGLSENFARCVMHGTYIEWAEYVTAKALARGVNGTPSMYVDGMGFPASADAIMSAAMAELS